MRIAAVPKDRLLPGDSITRALADWCTGAVAFAVDLAAAQLDPASDA